MTLNLRKGSRPLTRKIVGSYSDLEYFLVWFYEMNLVCMQSLKEEQTQLWTLHTSDPFQGASVQIES